jgi:hypothetical protein
MKIWALLAAVAATGLSGGAFAQTECSGTQLTFLDIKNSTVCVGHAGAWEAQEMHYENGILKDFKRGPSDKLDPTEEIGTWSMSGNTVTYNYKGGKTYSYSAYKNGATVTFCPSGSGILTTATLQPGTSGVPGGCL